MKSFDEAASDLAKIRYKNFHNRKRLSDQAKAVYQPLAGLHALLIELFRLQHDDNGYVKYMSNADLNRQDDLCTSIAAAIKAESEEK